MAAVPREQFVPEGSRPLAYTDRSVPLGGGRSMSTPGGARPAADRACARGRRARARGRRRHRLFGRRARGDRARGDGARSSDASSPREARGHGVEVVEGPLEEGWKQGAPYDLILIDGAVEHIPDAIVEQLADGGRLGTALIDRGVTRLIVGRRAGGGFGLHSHRDAGVAALARLRQAARLSHSEG